MELFAKVCMIIIGFVMVCEAYSLAKIIVDVIFGKDS
jgi:hypothetical protein